MPNDGVGRIPVEYARCPRPSSLQRTGKYTSLLGASGVLYLDVFEQPVSRCSFSGIMVKNSEKR